MGIFDARVPEEIEAAGDSIGKRVNVLIPSSVEVAAEEHVIVLQRLFALAQVWPLIAADDHPAREMDEAQSEQAAQCTWKRTCHHEDQPLDPRHTGPHWRDDVDGIRFTSDI